MIKTIYKILGKRGRITIPWEIRKELGFSHNDVVSFEVDGCSVIVKREKLCTDCNGSDSNSKNNSPVLKELLDELTPEELRTALIHLSIRWAEYTKSLLKQNGGYDHV